MKNGIINLNKPGGITSFQALEKVRSSIGRGIKIGHAGTLDPMAEGVLLILVGNATKVSNFLAGQEKEYIASMMLGITTDSHDSQGGVLETKSVTAAREEIAAVFREFNGVQLQVPPMLSAKKHKGEPLYRIFRRGEAVDRSPVEIKVEEIEMLEFCSPHVKFRVKCSKGTYVRTLCHDIGRRLGCGAHMTYLLRKRVGDFLLEDSVGLSDGRSYGDWIIPTETVMSRYPHITVNDSTVSSLRYNNRITENNIINRKELRTAMKRAACGSVFPVFDSNKKFIALAGRSRDEIIEFKLLRVIA